MALCGAKQGWVVAKNVFSGVNVKNNITQTGHAVWQEMIYVCIG
jgi:hypothetical protein